MKTAKEIGLKTISLSRLGSRYELYFHNQEWHNESWQPKASKFFPSILIITDKHYDVQSPYFRIFQTSSINKFMGSMSAKL
ncbi:hypothetical protein VK90_25020 [Bacillus sp. LK2]|nr:hypothetical protein VK90_25020 [Bacillus sp. LK2]